MKPVLRIVLFINRPNINLTSTPLECKGEESVCSCCSVLASVYLGCPRHLRDTTALATPPPPFHSLAVGTSETPANALRRSLRAPYYFQEKPTVIIRSGLFSTSRRFYYVAPMNESEPAGA